MTDIPESMKDELGGWNGGSGIGLQDWIECEGNFRLAVGYSTVFWPRFISLGKHIFLESVRSSVSEYDADCGLSPKETEALLNIVHLEDIQHMGCEDMSPDKLILLGNVLAEIYEAKLTWQFPKQPCVVDFRKPYDPEDFRGYQITFWQRAFES